MTKPYTEIRFTGTPEEINKQWVEARKNGVGGSDVASIMGLNKYSSPLNVWLVKTGREESPDLSNNQAVEWGNRLEDVVADKFADEHPELQVRRRNATMVSIKRPWAFANIDRWVTDGKGNVGILEVKTVGMRRAADWDSGVPLYYLTQVMHYMSVTGYKYAWVAVLIGGQEFREYYIERDEQDIQAINDAVDTFWRDFVETPQLSLSRCLTRMFPCLMNSKRLKTRWTILSTVRLCSKTRSKTLSVTTRESKPKPSVLPGYAPLAHLSIRKPLTQLIQASPTTT